MPKTEDGEMKAKKLIVTIVEETGVIPMTEDEWKNVQPIVEKLRGKNRGERGNRKSLENILKFFSGLFDRSLSFCSMVG